MSQLILEPLRSWDPERIGPYRIIARLEASAVGQVYLARSAAGRLVAVKTIGVELAEDTGFRASFAREVAAASRVSGVFTAAVIEADPDADLPWVATAYVPAPSLSTLVKRAGPLPVPAVRWLAVGCAEALQSIHAAGLLHRDVKPSNVLVAPDGPRVIDFGIARAAERVQLTATRGASGTPAYMAPEQARDATQASPASDVFSLGATLVYAATGHAPYEGETVMDILVRLATEPPDLTGMPEDLRDLAAACLQRVPADRPSPAAILARLTGTGYAEDRLSGFHLPESAMTLISEYQREIGDLLVPAEEQVSEGSGDEPARSAKPPEDPVFGVARDEARAAVLDALEWGATTARWQRIEEALIRMNAALEARDASALMEATADLELAGPVRLIRIGGPVSPPPQQVRDRINTLTHALSGHGADPEERA